MKSNEEFIAGIYEKAAVYTEEKETKIIKPNFAARTAKIAAMVVLCVGLAGVGIMTLGNQNGQNPNGVPEQASEDYGIALTSELGDELTGTSMLRMGPVVETVTVTGVVEQIDKQEKRIWLELIFDETAPDNVADSVVCIKWDMLEQIGDEIAVGKTLTVTGVLSEYENEVSEHHGCAELILTDLANLKIR